MDDQKDILLCMYQEHLKQARHQENQRSTMANLILIICTGLLGVMTIDKTLNITDLPLSIFLFMLGLYGAIFSAKYYERYKLHYERSRKIRKKIDDIFDHIEISLMQTKADRRTKEVFPIIFDLRLYWLWISLMLMISVVGLGLTLAILLINI